MWAPTVPQVGAHYWSAWVNVLTPYLAFSATTRAGVLVPPCTWPCEGGIQAPHSALERSGESGVTVFPVVFGWSREGLSESPLSCQAALFLVLWLQRAGFCWRLFWPVPLGVSRLLASPAPSLGSMRQKENPGTHHCVVPWVPRYLASLPSSLHCKRLLMFSIELFYI